MKSVPHKHGEGQYIIKQRRPAHVIRHGYFCERRGKQTNNTQELRSNTNSCGTGLGCNTFKITCNFSLQHAPAYIQALLTSTMSCFTCSTLAGLCLLHPPTLLVFHLVSCLTGLKNRLRKTSTTQVDETDHRTTGWGTLTVRCEHDVVYI